MHFEKLKSFINAWLSGLFTRLKAERVQIRSLPGETPMTFERVGNRAAECGYQLIWAPVAIQKRYRHADFDAAVDFVASDVGDIADRLGLTPKVEIDQGDVTVTLGIPIPPLLSEADFDVADALEAVAKELDAETDSTPRPRTDE